MKPGKTLRVIAVVCAICLLAVPILALATDTTAGGAESTKPHDNHGKKFRIAYCETEPFVNYAGTLYGLVTGLQQLGWVKDTSGLKYVDGQNSTKEMWSWLANNNVSPFLEFVSDAHYTLSEMEEDAGDSITKRFNERKDIDLVIVMGTKAGLKIANDQHSVPVTVFSTSNAFRSGIVKSVQTSGRERVWAHMDPELYQRQVQVFHDVFQFKKVGMVHEQSEVGKVLAAVADVEKVGKDRGFEVLTRPVKEPLDASDNDRYLRDMIAIHEELAQQVDAYYLYMSMLTPDQLPQVLKPFYDRKIPVFSQLGSEEVEGGALISVARADFSGIGSFGAETIVRILNGESASGLPQVFQNTPHIALNLDVAKTVGYRPSFEILLVADEIYQSGNKPKN
ncbi:MAG: hypothetical protein HPY50_07260 [Firmicutes bacterium]|nr:hypothetical protein [Bacillota bacterium]